MKKLLFLIALLLFSSPALLFSQSIEMLCAESIELDCGYGTVMGNNEDALTHTYAECESIAPTKVVWYIITGVDGQITASTCNPGTDFDTEIVIYTGQCAPNSLVCVDSNAEDPNCGNGLGATVSWDAIQGEDYFIAVAGESGATGNFELSVNRTFNGCSIYCIYADNISRCKDNGTLDYADDTFTADVEVRFTNHPVPGILTLTGDLLLHHQRGRE